MTNPLIKSVLGGAAIAAAVTLLPAVGANAQVRCMTDGYSWHCADGYFAPRPAPMWGPGWGYGYRGDYGQIPNDYPGPAPVYNNR